MDIVISLLIAIAFFIALFIVPVELNNKGYFKSLFGNKKINSSSAYKFYAVYQNGGFKSPSRHFVVHAFKTEEERNDFMRAMNNSQRKVHNEFDTYVIAVTEKDDYVKNAFTDMKNNPLIYNNVDYINQRIYIEHLSYE